MKNLIKRISMLGFMMLITLNTFAFNITSPDGQKIETSIDGTKLNLFSGMFKFGATMVFVVQVLVTIIMVVIIVWQVMNFVTGQQVDLGKVIMYVIGAVAVVILVWIAPNLLTSGVSNKEGTNGNGSSSGAIIRIEKIEKDLAFDGLEIK